MTNSESDRRGFIRVPFKTEVEIEVDTHVIKSDAQINVSMSGLYLPLSSSTPDPGTSCRVVIILKAFDNRLSIEATGKIIRSNPGSLAVEFTGLDIDSYTHLRQLILNNTEDPEKAEQEFIAHWGIKRPAL